MPRPAAPPTRRLLAASFALAVLGTLATAGCRQGAVDRPDAGLVWRECRLPGMSEAARCTSVPVFEDRQAARGRRLALHVAVFEALRPSPRPDPVYFIAGGPGQGASTVAHAVVPALASLRRDRDLVLVDIRGTGRSEALACEPWDEDPAMRRILDHRVPLEQLVACRDGQRADLRHYHTRNIVDDLDEVRAALGHARVNLYGVSYGTRAALAWMRRHPSSVRTATLDGVAPPQMRLFLPFARDGQAAFDRLASDCAAHEPCQAAFPQPQADLDRLLASLSSGPRTVTLAHPRTGEPLELEVTRQGVAGVLRGLLYSADLQALVPLMLRDALAGDFGPLVAQAMLLGETAEETTALALMLSVVCSEDLDRIDAAELSEAVSGTFVGTSMLEQARAMCGVWAHHPVPPSFFEPVRSDTPVLLLSGELDPVTPARWAALAAETLPRSLQVLVPAAAHGVWQTPCAGKVVRRFVDAGRVEGLDVGCLTGSKRPPFYLGRTGPAP